MLTSTEGPLLHRWLAKARKELVLQREAFKTFSSDQATDVGEWKKAVEDWEQNPGQGKNPFSHQKSGT